MEHDGAEFYTIGQRHGLGVGGGIHYYVTKKDIAANTIVVAEGPHDDALFGRELVATEVSWINGAPELPIDIEARIRYRQPLVRARVEPGGGSLRVVFQDDQRAITPGQSVVFYKDWVMLGGGVIA